MRAERERVVGYMRKFVVLGLYVTLIWWRFPWDQAALLMPILLMFGVMQNADTKLAESLQQLGLDGVAKEFRRRLGKDGGDSGGTIH